MRFSEYDADYLDHMRRWPFWPNGVVHESIYVSDICFESRDMVLEVYGFVKWTCPTGNVARATMLL